MQDLTTGPISRHLLKTSGFMLVMMVFNTLYFLIDLYWVGRLGTDAVAGVGIAGNVSFISLAVGQMMNVGTTTVISHAVGRRNREDATHLFNQALVLAVAIGIVFLLIGLVVNRPYAAAMSADTATATLAGDYLRWFVPAMAIQFPMGAMGASLRAAGQFKVPMIVSTGSIVLNMALAPVLIFGWGTGHPFGVAGAAMSTFVAVIAAFIYLVFYFRATDGFLRFDRNDWTPQLATWRRILAIGLPAGFEFAMMALYQFVVYAVTRQFGAAAQAGFGIGMRVVQAGFMPVVALGFAVAPVAGQNVGAGLGDRVRATFRTAAVLGSAIMALFALLSHIAPAAMVSAFSKDAAVLAVGEEYLRIISWNYVASGLLFVASSMFQALGNTLPSLVASAIRMAALIVPVVFLSRLPGFELHWVWYLAAGTVYLQLAIALLLLRREMARKLAFPTGAHAAPIVVPEAAG